MVKWRNRFQFCIKVANQKMRKNSKGSVKVKNLTCVIYEQPHDMYMQQVLNILTLEVREK